MSIKRWAAGGVSTVVTAVAVAAYWVLAVGRFDDFALSEFLSLSLGNTGLISVPKRDDPSGVIRMVISSQLPQGDRGAKPTLSRFEFSERHMGTLVRVTLYAADQATAQKASAAAFRRVKELDDRLSDYKPHSELMQLCGKAGTGPVPVSDDLFAVMARAQEIARLSDGAFDVTVGPVVRLWRLSRRTRQLPPAEELTSARKLVGYQLVKLDPNKKTVELTKPGMRLDLGGIAKGYAGDEMLRAMKAVGVTRALITIGGDVVAGDPPPDANGWTVAIAPLDANDKPPPLLLHDTAVSTSGDAEQFVEIGGVRYSHIIDPRTGIGLTGRSAATVVAADGLTADPLAKIVTILGPERGFKVVDSNQRSAARLAVQDGEHIIVHNSSRFLTFIKQVDK